MLIIGLTHFLEFQQVSLDLLIEFKSEVFGVILSRKIIDFFARRMLLIRSLRNSFLRVVGRKCLNSIFVDLPSKRRILISRAWLNLFHILKGLLVPVDGLNPFNILRRNIGLSSRTLILCSWKIWLRIKDLSFSLFKACMLNSVFSKVNLISHLGRITLFHIRVFLIHISVSILVALIIEKYPRVLTLLFDHRILQSVYQRFTICFTVVGLGHVDLSGWNEFLVLEDVVIDRERSYQFLIAGSYKLDFVRVFI